MHTSECQGGSFAPSGTYSPPFNDIWSLGIILLNLITGRNPWKSASSSDPTFQAYLQSPANFLPSVLPISAEVNEILLRTLDIDWRNRISITELRRAIKGVRTFYADDVVFEGSMARCSWEAGIDITGGSQPDDDGFDLPPHEEQQQKPRSGWSRESSTDIVFAAPSRGDSSEWVPYPASRATWGLDSDLRTDTSSQGSVSFLTYGDHRTLSSSPSIYSPALSEPFASSQGDEESTYIDGSERLKPEPLSISTASELYEGCVITRSTDSTTMHMTLESSVSVAQPSYAAPSASEVGISTYGEDDERLRDSMSRAHASTCDQRTRAEDLVNVSSMDFKPTEQKHTAMHATISRSPVSGNSGPDFYSMIPLPPSPPPQAQGLRMRLPFRLLPFRSSPATTTRTKDVCSIPVQGLLEEPNANSDIDSICGDRYDLFSRSRPQI